MAVAKVRPAAQGNLVVHCNDKKSLENLQNSADNELGKNYEIRVGNIIKPKIVLM